MDPMKDLGKLIKAKMMNLTEREAGMFLAGAIAMNVLLIGLLLLV